MFRLTISGPIAEQWKNTFSSTLKPEQRRIYRWDTMWGILVNNQWTVEKRKPIIESDSMILESIDFQQSIHAPPIHCDDIWDEEFYFVKNAEWNDILSVCMYAHDILAWASKHSISLPNSIVCHLQSMPANMQNMNEVRCRELIPQNPKGKLKSFVTAKHPAVKKSRCLVMDD